MNEKELMERYQHYGKPESYQQPQQPVKDEQKDIQPVIRFSHNMNVLVIRGFYTGYQGIVKNYFIHEKDKTIFYEVEVKELDGTKVIFKETDIQVMKGFLGRLFTRT
jgi:ribosomal protein S4E